MNTDTVEIDLLELFFALVKKWWLIVTSMILCGIIAFSYSTLFITPLYQASAKIYVNNSSVSLDNAKLSITSSDISASQSLVDTYIVILKSRPTLEAVIEEAKLNYTYEELLKMLTAKSLDGTEVFSVTVTSSSPSESELIANTIADVLPDKISTIIDGSSARIVEFAIIPGQKVSPSITKNTLIGMVLGAVLACGVIVVLSLMDYKVHSEDYILDKYPEIPLLAKVPDINEEHGKGYGKSYKKGYYYNQYQHYEASEDAENKKQTKGKKSTDKGRLRMVGPHLSFASREAYKLLRVNLGFSLSDVAGARVIGVTSALRGEGKSLTSINIAYSLAESENRVLLLEFDMRIPTLAYKLRLNNKDGLTDAFSEGVSIWDVIHPYTMSEKGERTVTMDILPSGTIPPNPSELIASQKMEAIFEELKKHYDYIIVDMPPILAVSDALTASKLLHGVVLVVRQDYSEKGAMAETMRQISFSDIRVLGCVMNAVTEGGDASRYRYRYKYGKKYYGGYKNYKSYNYEYSTYESSQVKNNE